MKSNNRKKYSKRELLEIMLAQQIEIEKLENTIKSLKEEIKEKDEQVTKVSDLVSVTNKLQKLTKSMEFTLKYAALKKKVLDD